ncbi:recombinase family protein [Piscinibacter gummiphilus]|uniref:Recombinase family protein n=1 Tax=Piscinibacter gummiphilus TaxID=946333 RepID=A0ABZ0CU15_9BURK|nr:recombinase family protein [Piscinibacter gummiphilus]WOB06450.1 recombinase family protein [Piscinibacter gummiphilus]
MEQPPRVYSYLRFSNIKQAAGASADRQRSYAAEWAAKHGLQLDEELSMRDEGLSAFHQTHIKKGALGVFLRAIEDGKVAPKSVLVVESLDRLSRAEPLLAQAQMTSIINADITVVTASDNKVYSRERLKANPMDLIYSLLVMIRAHEESDTKSKRVTDAIRRKCKGWVAGTYRGRVSIGQTPGWLRMVDGKWELIPERVAAIRLVFDRHRAGHGMGHIVKELHDAGLQVSDSKPDSGHLIRLFTQRALIGEKHVELGDETYVLEGYYPPVLTKKEWEALQTDTAERSRKFVKGDIPSILTGFGVTICGYCGSPMKGQTMANKRRPDGTLSDGHRRLQCAATNRGGCAVEGSCSAGPIERAITGFCSDMLNLRGLAGGDRSVGPRAEIEAARAKMRDIDAQLERLTDAMLSSESAPAAFTKRARELEEQQHLLRERIKQLEDALAVATRSDLAGADLKWASLAKAAEQLDYTARMTTRQMVADTFQKIVVFHHGIRPRPGRRVGMDVVLVSKAGISRLIEISPSGAWTVADEFDLEAVTA